MAGNDLNAGFYWQTNRMYSLLGQITNVVDTTKPAFTNLVPGQPLIDGAVATTGIATSTPVPVDVGATITNVIFITGATAASSPTHSWAALYQGTGVTQPVFIAQVTDKGSAAIGSKTVFTYALSSATQITSTMAPHGFIYVSLMFASTVAQPSVVSYAAPTATQIFGGWFTNSPRWTAATHGSALTTTASSPMDTQALYGSTTTGAPIIILT